MPPGKVQPSVQGATLVELSFPWALRMKPGMVEIAGVCTCRNLLSSSTHHVLHAVGGHPGVIANFSDKPPLRHGRDLPQTPTLQGVGHMPMSLEVPDNLLDGGHRQAKYSSNRLVALPVLVDRDDGLLEVGGQFLRLLYPREST